MIGGIVHVGDHELLIYPSFSSLEEAQFPGSDGGTARLRPDSGRSLGQVATTPFFASSALVVAAVLAIYGGPRYGMLGQPIPDTRPRRKASHCCATVDDLTVKVFGHFGIKESDLLLESQQRRELVDVGAV